MNEFFTWELLATVTGAAIATGLVTAVMDKWLNGNKKLPTQVISYLTALSVLLLANFFIGNLTISTGVICVFNALIVSGATSNTISGVKRLSNKKNNVIE